MYLLDMWGNKCWKKIMQNNLIISREQIQNYVDERMHEIILGERLFIQNKLMTSNFPSVSRIHPFFI